MFTPSLVTVPSSLALLVWRIFLLWVVVVRVVVTLVVTLLLVLVVVLVATLN
jgi:hypothetical protein